MRLRHLALPAVAGLALLAVPFAPAALAAPAACTAADNPCVVDFAYTGSVQTFQVPAGVSNLLVALGGAKGGAGLEADGSPAGGSGGALEAIVPVTPGETLSLVVGGKGGDAVPPLVLNGAAAPAAAPTPAPATGGYGGGGNGTSAIDGPSGAGGGGSFLFSGDGTLLVAAGGGGGAGFTGTAKTPTDGGNGGAGGAAQAGAGVNGGGGATTAGGGAPGGGDAAVGGTGPASGPAAFGTGGAATGTCAAGGGGGGYFGGGSGGCVFDAATETAKPAARAAAASPAAIVPIVTAGGGGGGAGFVGNGASEVATLVNGLSDGAITLGYTTAPTTTTLTTSATTLAPGQDATLNAKVQGAPTVIGDPADAKSAAAKVAARAFGAQAAALAVPTQPAPAGTTVDPATACGTAKCTVTFFVNGTKLGDPITVDPATSTATVVFTAGSELGLRSITARYDGNLYYLQSTSNTAQITVAGLANTGAHDIAPLIGTAAGLLLVGAGMLTYGRRRPATGAHHAA